MVEVSYRGEGTEGDEGSNGLSTGEKTMSGGELGLELLELSHGGAFLYAR